MTQAVSDLKLPDVLAEVGGDAAMPSASTTPAAAPALPAAAPSLPPASGAVSDLRLADVLAEVDAPTAPSAPAVPAAVAPPAPAVSDLKLSDVLAELQPPAPVATPAPAPPSPSPVVPPAAPAAVATIPAAPAGTPLMPPPPIAPAPAAPQAMPVVTLGDAPAGAPAQAVQWRQPAAVQPNPQTSASVQTPPAAAPLPANRVGPAVPSHLADPQTVRTLAAQASPEYQAAVRAAGELAQIRANLLQAEPGAPAPRPVANDVMRFRTRLDEGFFGDALRQSYTALHTIDPDAATVHQEEQQKAAEMQQLQHLKGLLGPEYQRYELAEWHGLPKEETEALRTRLNDRLRQARDREGAFYSGAVSRTVYDDVAKIKAANLDPSMDTTRDRVGTLRRKYLASVERLINQRDQALDEAAKADTAEEAREKLDAAFKSHHEALREAGRAATELSGFTLQNTTPGSQAAWDRLRRDAARDASFWSVVLEQGARTATSSYDALGLDFSGSKPEKQAMRDYADAMWQERPEASVVGSVAGQALDPTMYISGGAGGVVSKEVVAAAKLAKAGRVGQGAARVAGRAASGAMAEAGMGAVRNVAEGKPIEEGVGGSMLGGAVGANIAPGAVKAGGKLLGKVRGADAAAARAMGNLAGQRLGATASGAIEEGIEEYWTGLVGELTEAAAAGRAPDLSAGLVDALAGSLGGSQNRLIFGGGGKYRTEDGEFDADAYRADMLDAYGAAVQTHTPDTLRDVGVKLVLAANSPKLAGTPVQQVYSELAGLYLKAAEEKATASPAAAQETTPPAGAASTSDAAWAPELQAHLRNALQDESLEVTPVATPADPAAQLAQEIVRAATGREVAWYSTPNGRSLGTDGTYLTKSGTIALNADYAGDAQITRTAVHELLHWVKRNDGKAFTDFEAFVSANLPTLYAKAKASYAAGMEKALPADMVRKLKSNDALQHEEGLARLTEILLQDPEALRRLAKEKPGVAAKIAEFFRGLVDRLRGKDPALARQIQERMRIFGVLKEAGLPMEAAAAAEARTAAETAPKTGAAPAVAPRAQDAAAETVETTTPTRDQATPAVEAAAMLPAVEATPAQPAGKPSAAPAVETPSPSPSPAPAPTATPAAPAAEAPAPKRYKRPELEAMKFKALSDLAATMGIKRQAKAKIVNAILARQEAEERADRSLRAQKAYRARKEGKAPAKEPRKASDLLLRQGVNDGLFPEDWEYSADTRVAINPDSAEGLSASQKSVLGLRRDKKTNRLVGDQVNEDLASNTTAHMDAEAIARNERAMLARFAATKEERIAQAVQHYMGPDVDPLLRRLAVYAEAEGTGPKQELPIEKFGHGDTFTVGGRPFRVVVDADTGATHFLDEDVDLPYADSFPDGKMKIDRGSLEKPEAGGDDVAPFNVRDDDRAKPLTGAQRGLLGERFDGAATGGQRSLMDTRPDVPSALEQQGNEVGQAEKDGETGALFNVRGQGEAVEEALRRVTPRPARVELPQPARTFDKAWPALKKWFLGLDPVATAADGSRILVHSPDQGARGRIENRLVHMLTDGKRFHVEKARWIGRLVESLTNADLRAVDGRSGNRVYVRKYPEGVHAVVVKPDGTVEDHQAFTGELITQFTPGDAARQMKMRVDWWADGYGRSQSSSVPSAGGSKQTGLSTDEPNPTKPPSDSIVANTGEEVKQNPPPPQSPDAKPDDTGDALLNVRPPEEDPVDAFAKRLAAKVVRVEHGDLLDGAAIPEERIPKLVSPKAIWEAVQDVLQESPREADALRPLASQAVRQARQLIADARKVGFDQALAMWETPAKSDKLGKVINAGQAGLQRTEKVVMSAQDALVKAMRLREEGRRAGLQEGRALRRQLLDAASRLPREDRAKLLPMLANLENQRDYGTRLERINTLISQSIKRQAVAEVRDLIEGLDRRHMRPEFKAQMDALLERIDLHRMSSGTEARLAGLQAYVNSNSDALETLPQRARELLERANREPLDGMSLSDLQVLGDTIRGIVHQNHLKNALLLKHRREELAVVGGQAINELDTLHAPLPEKGGGDKAASLGDVGLGRKFLQYTDGPEVMTVDAFGEDGTAHQILYKDLIAGEGEALRLSQEAQDDLQTTLDAHKMDPYALIRWGQAGRTLKLASGEALELTGPELVSVAMLAENAGAREKLLGNGVVSERYRGQPDRTHTITGTDLYRIDQALTPFERELKAKLLALYNGRVKEALNQVSLEVYGYDMYTEENYSPLTIDTAQRQQNVVDIKDIFGVRWLEQSGFTKERVQHRTPVVLTNAMNTFHRHLAQSTTYGGLMVPVRNARMLLGAPDVQAAVRARLGSRFIPAMQDYLLQVSGTMLGPRTVGEQWAQVLARNAAVATLGLRASTVLVNYTTAPVTLATQLSATENKALLRQFLKPRYAAGDTAAWQELRALSPYLRERYEGESYRLVAFAEGDMAGMLADGVRRQKWRNFQEATLKPMNLAERKGIIDAWKALVEVAQTTSPGVPLDHIKARAAEKLELAVRRTQNPTSGADMSQFGRQTKDNPFLGMAFMFTSQAAKLRDLARLEYLRFARSKKAAADRKRLVLAMGLLAMGALVLPAGVRELFRRVREGFREEEARHRRGAAYYAAEAAGEIATTIHPLMGDAASAMLEAATGRTPRPSEGPVGRGATNLYRGIADLGREVNRAFDRDPANPDRSKLLTDDARATAAERMYRAASNFARAMATFSGVPLDGPLQIVEGGVKAVKGRPPEFGLKNELYDLRQAEKSGTLDGQQKRRLRRLENLGGYINDIRRREREGRMTSQDADGRIKKAVERAGSTS